MAGQILSDYKVLDFGQYIAGPYAAMLLAEQGAEVIKVENPKGDPYRGQEGFRVWNRSKKAIALDLKKPECHKVALDLAKHADIVIENFKPGVAVKLGIGYNVLKELNPRIIYCSISGFGSSGPYSNIPGYEPLVSALGSVYTEQGYGAHPLYIVLPIASYYAAFHAAYAITVALYVREMIGMGQKIEISMFKSILGAQRIYMLDFAGRFRVPWGPTGVLPLYRLYQCSDGKWFFLALGNFKFFTKFCLAVKHEEWLSDPLFEGAPFLILPPRNAKVIAMLKDIFITKPQNVWMNLLREEGLPVAPVRLINEFMNDPQVIINEMVVSVDEPGLGKVKEMGIPVKMELCPGAVKSASPSLGQHSREILKSLGYSTTSINNVMNELGIK